MESGGASLLDSGSNEASIEIDREGSDDKKALDARTPGSASATLRKIGGSKETGNSILNSVNKSTSQIKKPPHRRNASPLNWFPRKKAESFLKRKIRLLQEVGGLNSSLDETLGDANPHYSRIAREKIAAREAAKKAMEACKAAMVEASWCRILLAARIKSKEAETELEKAEKHAAEALKAATALGVMMYDKPDYPRHLYDVETSLSTIGGSTQTVNASFETAFEVDKEVAAAVKEAFIRLASCPHSNHEEFRDLLYKISQNPDATETDQESSEISSECVSDPGSELEPELHAVKKEDMELDQRKSKDRLCPADHKQHRTHSFEELVNTMLDRLKGLQEEQLSSLAIIVATCGLNAALLEVDSGKNRDLSLDNNSTLGSAVTRRLSSLRAGTRRYSSITRFMDGHMRNKEALIDVPSLDKLLVKHVSRLEREVQEARNSRKSTSTFGNQKTSEASEVLIHPNGADTSQDTSDLGSVLVDNVSRHEKHTQETNTSVKNSLKSEENNVEPFAIRDFGNGTAKLTYVSHLSGCIAKSEGTSLSNCSHVKDNQGGISEAADGNGRLLRNLQGLRVSGDTQKLMPPYHSDERLEYKENIDINTCMTLSNTAERICDDESSAGCENARTKRTNLKKPMSRIERAKLETLKAFSCHFGDGGNESHEQVGLDKILVKTVHWLEREKMQALDCRSNRRADRKQGSDVTTFESLDKVLVKHVSRLEKEKLALQTKEGIMEMKERHQQPEESGESLDEILVKHQSKLEKAKLDAAQKSLNNIKSADIRREARERELLEAWGGLSLGNSIRPHLSRLERDKAAWRKAEEEEQRRAMGEL